MEKEKWIDEILQSAKQIQTVESSPYLAIRIETKLQQPVVTGRMHLSYVLAAAAALIVILFVNITVWRSTINSSAENKPLQNLIREYGWSNSDFYSAANQN